MDDKDFSNKLLLSMNDKVAVISNDVAELKTDMKEHIRRTNILESKVGWLERIAWTVTGGAGVVYFLLKLFKVI